MWRVTRLLVVTVFVVLLAAPVASATVPGRAGGDAPAGTASGLVLAQLPTATAPNPTAPAGPSLTPEQQSTKSRQKLAIGVLVVVLLAVVVVGRSTRRRMKKKSQGAVSK